jgi:hypothetical protein
MVREIINDEAVEDMETQSSIPLQMECQVALLLRWNTFRRRFGQSKIVCFDKFRASGTQRETTTTTGSGRTRNFDDIQMLLQL